MGFTDNLHHDEHDRDGCCSVVKKKIGVQTPVEVKVKTHSGHVKVMCSTPYITGGGIEQAAHHHGGCGGTKCEFVINQTICLEIPISYRVRTDVKDSFVNCDVGGQDG